MSIAVKRLAALKWPIFVSAAALLAACYFLYGVKVQTSVSRTEHVVCDLRQPIKVTVYNFTFRRLAKVTLALEGWRNGRSTNILSKNIFVFDTAVQPFSRQIQCFGDAAFLTQSTLPVTDSKKEMPMHIGDIFKEIHEFNRKIDGVEIVAKDINPEFY